MLVHVRIIGRENMRTAIGRYNTIKLELTFEALDDTERMRSDILTNNLIREENTLKLWFTDDDRRIPVRAKYITRPFNVFWNIRRYYAF
jgi:hypothetical protein